MIGIEDFRYRDRFQELANEWVSSWRCIVAGILAMVSSEVSMLILAFMSVERFLLISNPFGQRCITGKNVIVCLFTIWVVGIMLAITPGIFFNNSVQTIVWFLSFYLLHSHSPPKLIYVLWRVFISVLPAVYRRTLSLRLAIFSFHISRGQHITAYNDCHPLHSSHV